MGIHIKVEDQEPLKYDWKLFSSLAIPVS